MSEDSEETVELVILLDGGEGQGCRAQIEPMSSPPQRAHICARPESPMSEPTIKLPLSPEAYIADRLGVDSSRIQFTPGTADENWVKAFAVGAVVIINFDVGDRFNSNGPKVLAIRQLADEPRT
jgi:hypothetical protein